MVSENEKSKKKKEAVKRVKKKLTLYLLVLKAKLENMYPTKEKTSPARR